MHRFIYNNPEERLFTTYSWVYWDNAFTNDELLKIESYCSSKETKTASIVGSEDLAEIKKIRKSNVQFYERNLETQWIFERFNSIIETINERYYGYDLNGYRDFQYTEYRGDESGEYNWHQDMLHGPNTFNYTRKLSMILCLSEPEKDFVGGQFEINTGNQEFPELVDVKRGRMIFFPSYIIHRVKPVTSGTRKSIVVWITGPKFV